MNYRKLMLLPTLVLAAAACSADATSRTLDATSLTASDYRFPAPPNFKLSPDTATITVGQTLQIRPVYRDDDGRVLDRVVGVVASYTSSNPDIATVDRSGRVEAHDRGVVTIVGSANGKKAAAVLTVRSAVASTSKAGGDTGTAKTAPAPTGPVAPAETPAQPAPSAPVSTSGSTTAAPAPPSTSSTPSAPPSSPPSIAAPASSEPLPRAGDRMLLDSRQSIQQGTDLRSAWPAATWEMMWGPFGFTTDMDGSGTRALRVQIPSSHGQCVDGGGGSLLTYFPQPYAKHVIFTWKMRMGRTATGGGIGAVGSFQITNSACGNAGRKMFLISRPNPSTREGARMEYIWPGPAPVIPRITSDMLNYRVGPIAGASFDPQLHVGQTIVQTLELKAESSPGARDGIVRLWINGVKIIEDLHAPIGTEGFSRFQMPATFRAPAQDQTEYYWDVVAWSPQG